MADNRRRPYKAGEAMGKAIVEMVHLMYQNKTATKFYRGLSKIIQEEIDKRCLSEKNNKK